MALSYGETNALSALPAKTDWRCTSLSSLDINNTVFFDAYTNFALSAPCIKMSASV